MDKTGQMNLAEWIKGRELKDLVLPDGPDDDFIVIDKFPEIDYVLLYRNTKYEPWVAAWKYNDERKSWGQGHYFENLVYAMSYIMDLLKEKEQKNDLASQIELDYTKNHLWENKVYDLMRGFTVELSMNTDSINRVNIKLYYEDGAFELEWYTDAPECIAENIRSLIDLYID